jgi:hypothetical protein
MFANKIIGWEKIHIQFGNV